MATSITLEPIVVTEDSKNLIDHLEDFYDGISTFVTAPYGLGDYLARISGFRDYQIGNESVMIDELSYQDEAILQTRATYEALKLIAEHPEEWGKLLNAFSNHLKDRPAYYAGSFLTGSAISKTLFTGIEKMTYTSLSKSGSVSTSVDDIYKKLENLLGITGNNFENLINPNVNDWWQQARNWVPRRDPLVLDLDGDGIETVGISATTHILFDHNNDGIATGTGWVKGDDGLLVLDRNGNGVIDNGSELFGDSTTVNGVKATDGFSALRAEDTNARHPEFNSGSKREMPNRVRHDGDAVNNFNFKNTRRTA